MANVQPLRAEPAPVMQRSPERERLATAIARHRECEEHLSRVTDAKPKAWAASTAALLKVEEAEALLSQAKAEEPQRLARRFMGEDDNGTALKDAVAALAEARAEYEMTQRAHEALRAEEDRASRALKQAEHDLTDALAGVVQSAPGITQLVEQFDAARARVDALAAVLRFLQRRMLLPDEIGRHWEAINRPLPPTEQILPAWTAAITALEHDADAPLPGDD